MKWETATAASGVTMVAQAITDRVDVSLLTVNDRQLASSGAVAEGCIQPLIHWWLA
jgi:hypothetical protein